MKYVQRTLIRETDYLNLERPREIRNHSGKLITWKFKNLHFDMTIRNDLSFLLILYMPYYF